MIGRPLEEIRPWLFNYGRLGLVKVCGMDAVDLEAVRRGMLEQLPATAGIIRLQDLEIDTDVIVLSTPEIAGMPYVIAGLVAAGGLAAALSTADGLLLAIANALSHDIYYKMLDPNAPDLAPAHRLARAAARGGGAGRLYGIDQALGHSVDGVLGVLAGRRRHLPGAGARHLVEARQLDRGRRSA